MNEVPRTDQSRKTRHGAARKWPAEVPAEIIRRLEAIDSSAQLATLRRDFGAAGVRVELVPGEMAPPQLRGNRPEIWVDAEGERSRRALCISVPRADTRISDVIYAGAEALAVARVFPREPGNYEHEALINGFALSYVTAQCGSTQAIASFKLQLRRAQRARLQGAVDHDLRRRIALRCWAIGTALNDEEERILLGQIQLADEGIMEMIYTLKRLWGDEAPQDGPAAERLLARSGDPLKRG